MPRTLPSGVSAQLTNENAHRVHLLELRFSAGTTYLTDAPEDVVVSGTTYTGLGGLIEIGAAEETADDKGQGLSLGLAGVNQSVVSALLTNFYRGRLAILSRVYFDANGAVIGGPVEVFRGYMNENWRIRTERGQGFEPGTVRVETRVVSRVSMAGQRRGIRTNLVSHQRVFSGDLFFQYVSQLTNKVIRFGGVPVILAPGTGKIPGTNEDLFNWYSG